MSDAGLYSKIPQPFQNIGCQELLKEDISMCGWVRKRHFTNKFKLFRWPKVYMVISKGCVYYFRNEFCKTVSGKFSLFGFNSVKRATDVSSETAAKFPFRIDHTHAKEFKSYYFACSSEREMKEWMKVIKNELQIANDSQKRDGDYYYSEGLSRLKIEQTPERQGASDDSGFGHSADGDSASLAYKDIEEKIYDDPDSLQLPSDYGTKYAKRADEGTDDEDIPDEPPPIPPRMKSSSAAGGQKKEKKRKKKKKQDSVESDIPKEKVTRTESKAESKAKEAAEAIASGVKGHFKALQEQRSSIDSPSLPSQGRKQSLEPSPSLSSVDKKQSLEASTQQDEEEEDDDEESEAYWNSIHFNGEKEEASEVIRNIAENGVFLVRSGEGGKVLVVFADNMPKKYRIQTKDNQHFLAQAGPKADTLEDLLFEYFTVDLPNTNVKLTTPYSLHSKFR